MNPVDIDNHQNGVPILDRLAWSIADLAFILGRKKRFVWYLASREGLPVRRVSKMCRRVTRPDLVRWLHCQPRLAVLAQAFEEPFGRNLPLVLDRALVADLINVSTKLTYTLEKYGLPFNDGRLLRPLLEQWLADAPLLREFDNPLLRPQGQRFPFFKAASCTVGSKAAAAAAKPFRPIAK